MSVLLNELHGVHHLAQQTLVKPKGLLSPGTQLHPHIAIDDVRYALSRVGAGLDHTLGEQAIVFGELSIDPKKAPFASYLLVTDRRFVGTVGWASGKVANVRFSHIEEVGFKSGVLTIDLKVRAGQEWHDLSFGDIEEHLRNFLRTLVAQPYEGREPPIRPLCVPTEDDPTGATVALGWLPVRDPRTELLLTYLREATRRGAMTVEVGQDFVSRVVLAYRNLFLGRGQHAGRYMSPVSADDLSQLMVHMFGNPISHTEQPVRTLVLASNMRSDTGAAALSSAVGIAASAIIGIGWVRRARPTVPNFSFMVADTGPFASYRLFQSGTSVGLHRKVPVLCDDIHYNLMTLEDALLLRRCVHGWNHRPIELMGSDPNEVLQRLSDVVGPFSPDVLRR